MGKKRKKTSSRQGLQVVTLCISTALVLILLGLVVFSVLTARNLSAYVKQNLVVTLFLDNEVTPSEASKLAARLKSRTYVNGLDYISREQALKEGIETLGADPSEFIGENPFSSSMELTLKSDYANNDSLAWIAKELKAYPKVTEIKYQKDLIEAVNRNLAKISLVLLVLAVLLTFVSFSLINNTVRLGIYARRFSIHTMKLVGASWGFIRRPFVRRAVVVGLIAAVIACLVLGGLIWLLYRHEPEILTVITWEVLAITAAVVFVFGILITAMCANISVNKFLRMKAGELYKI
ncbi:MAG: permease-like cell division protein FtsX [Prevotella sp.]|nr:permease-like cell division protein FtsX [Prevotella sp.]